MSEPARRTTKTAAARSRKRGPSTARTTVSTDDPDTRQHVIDAAIQSILDLGFYRASSNVIAERAGVTWGVIQYHFGTRENLLLSVLDYGTKQLAEELSKADIRGDTLTGRIEDLLDVIQAYYGSPEYLAYLQVTLNLSHDPTTSDQTIATIRRFEESVATDMDRLFSKVFAGYAVPRGHQLRTMMFHSLRGIAMSERILLSLPWSESAGERQVNTRRQLLAESLALLVDSKAAKKV